ncbi:MAG: hypothetical protein IPP33_16665 [Flavobacteriales bacterium]|nr:hypothetical protein [Flavobacteriales bacterium]
MWATARDGQRVPMSIVKKKGTRSDGTSPLLLYGYGSHYQHGTHFLQQCATITARSRVLIRFRAYEAAKNWAWRGTNNGKMSTSRTPFGLHYPADFLLKNNS